ncbi:hypothetical protein [Streptomyces sp. MA5143a]|uniref:hypothetical protein n=1 Tax=Streptomyces sp. MA5143a TaxID=2083010 RepID=UPI000D1AAC64|nr:hypothetical protein [Streptomyces sp. MA5143a]SPF04096.1 hypothetical protein SMA5143A_4893 [Streptomyces sp. MA5143a]
MRSASVRRGVTAAALTAVLALSPLAATAVADARGDGVVRLRLTGVTAVDTKPRHVEPGDSWVTRLNLYTRKKKFAGDAGARCAAVEATGHRVTTQCTRVLRLKKGEITLNDMITRENPAPITAKTSIAGGTGVYKDAEGDGYITLDGDRVHFDLRVED